MQEVNYDEKQFTDKAIIFLNFREPGNVFHGETKQ